MHRLSVVRWLAAGLAICAMVWLPAAAAPIELEPLSWAHDTQMQFGIYNGSDERFATAYYRILKEKVNGNTLYHFKYLGRNEQMSESAEVWVDPKTQLPIRSTRKVAGRSKTFYADVAYEPGLITVRQKYEGQAVSELKVPSGDGFFDFEQLIWLIPQIKWSKDDFAYLNYFNTFKFQLETAVVTREGPDRAIAKDKSYPAERYSFSVGATRYTYWTVDQKGHATPARIFMDDADDRRDITFVNLGLDSRKVSTGGVESVPPGTRQSAPVPTPSIPMPPPAIPTPPPPTTPPDESEPPTDDNPLVPANPGGRFP